jgi:cell wall-associated NlpC family hydrolase
VNRRLLLVAAAAALCACVWSAHAQGSSPIAAKQAQAAQVYNQVLSLDENLSREDELINLANVRLAQVASEQRVNLHELYVARLNLGRSRTLIARRLLSLYTTPQASTLELILGASSMSDLLTRIDDANRLSSLDTQVIGQVESFQAAAERASHDLASEHAAATRLVAERQDERLSLQNQLGERQQLLLSIKGQIATLEAQAAARQRELEQEAQARVAAAQAAEVAQDQSQVIGASAATPQGDTVLPASPYGSQVVSIAMSFLGVPYVWGGASPSGFDCSGLVMYAYDQVGISLPHSSYAMWDYGIPVPENELEPGDLVFFDGLGHVGMYIGGGEYVNAPYTGTVVSVASLDDAWAQANYVGARRIT